MEQRPGKFGLREVFKKFLKTNDQRKLNAASSTLIHLITCSGEREGGESRCRNGRHPASGSRQYSVKRMPMKCMVHETHEKSRTVPRIPFCLEIHGVLPI